MKLPGAARLALVVAAISSSGALLGSQEVAPSDNAELARMFEEDQADRRPGPNGIDWAAVKPRDDARLARTKELYAAGALQTGPDWLHAALILQHSEQSDDYLLAHEMCVAALAAGERNARWLAAATEDRFLRSLGRRQRFGTQYEAGQEAGTFRLAETDPQVTDELRQALGAPTLAEAKARESQFNEK